MKDRLKLLEMRARAMLPVSVRSAYRMARSVAVAQPMSPELPQDLVAGCRMFGSRLDLLDELPKHGRVAELGTYKGDFAREILARSQPAELHLIDIDYTLFDVAIGRDPRVTCHTGLTDAMIATFPDRHFDWIYIDGEHSYDGVARDIAAAAPKVKPGGCLVFNDFAHIDPLLGRYGVHRAVVEFAIAERWPMSHFAMQGAALYDVALRRPGMASRNAGVPD
jgi:SAM-dependent methyltransferase